MAPPDCINLPFGLGDASVGCPTNSTGWFSLISSVSISGSNEWNLYEITITPDRDMAAIAIGPYCVEDNNITEQTYYFFDKLILAERSAFEFSIRPEGHPCSNEFQLRGPDRDTLTYQWYLDGVALIGEDRPTLFPEERQGRFELRLNGPSSCNLLEPYIHEIPFLSDTIVERVCVEDGFQFKGDLLTESGEYNDTLVSVEGCDSLLTLVLTVDGLVRDTVQAGVLPPELYQIGSQYFADQGSYDITLTNQLGCDSLLHLRLDHYYVFIPNAFSPNFDGVNDVFTIYPGVGVEAITEFEIYDRWGGRINDIFNTEELNGVTLPSWNGNSSSEEAPTGLYIYRIKILFDDGKERMFKGEILLTR